MADRTFLNAPIPWGLGFHKDLDEPTFYGHGGRLSSMAGVEPTRDLVFAVITNGLPSAGDNVRRFRDIRSIIRNACHGSPGM